MKTGLSFTPNADLTSNHPLNKRRMNVCTIMTNKNTDGNDDDMISSNGCNFPIMSKKEIRNAALEHSGYSTPALNDQLYLHYKGYQKIENLEEYINLKALWLDSNGLQKIENIDHLSSLRCLFLQRNLLSCIENVQGLESLVQLGTSMNRIMRMNVAQIH